MKQKICIYIAFLCCILPKTWAYQPENVPLPQRTSSAYSGFVSNPDGILSPAAVEQINQTCYQLYRTSEAELAVVAIRDIEGYDMADFAQRLFMHWGIGDRQRNTGVLIILATDSRDIRIHTGGGIEGLLPDAACSSIISDVMVPYLSEDQWDEGIVAGHALHPRGAAGTAARMDAQRLRRHHRYLYVSHHRLPHSHRNGHTPIQRHAHARGRKSAGLATTSLGHLATTYLCGYFLPTARLLPRPLVLSPWRKSYPSDAQRGSTQTSRRGGTQHFRHQ